MNNEINKLMSEAKEKIKPALQHQKNIELLTKKKMSEEAKLNEVLKSLDPVSKSIYKKYTKKIVNQKPKQNDKQTQDV